MPQKVDYTLTVQACDRTYLELDHMSPGLLDEALALILVWQGRASGGDAPMPTPAATP